MEHNFNKLKNLFYKVKNKGWIEGDDKGNGSIGLTFEKLIGIPSNGFQIPDFYQIEIKTKTKCSNSYTTLFSCTPTGPHYHEVKRLRDLYGYPDSKLKTYKVLNTSIYAKYMKKVGLNFFFELKIDKEKQKIYLLIYDKEKNLIENDVYWDFDILKEKLYRKLKFLAFIIAEKKIVKGIKYFKYTNMSFYKLKNFDTFINLLDKGVIKINFKIGTFREGTKKGQIYDHGTSFSIHEANLKKLYDLIVCYK